MAKDIYEAFRKIGEDDADFDIRFWQAQGPEAIFNAALQMVVDAQIVRYGHADEPRLDRTLESFRKA